MNRNQLADLAYEQYKKSNPHAGASWTPADWMLRALEEAWTNGRLLAVEDIRPMGLTAFPGDANVRDQLVTMAFHNARLDPEKHPYNAGINEGKTWIAHEWVIRAMGDAYRAGQVSVELKGVDARADTSVQNLRLEVGVAADPELHGKLRVAINETTDALRQGPMGGGILGPARDTLTHHLQHLLAMERAAFWPCKVDSHAEIADKIGSAG